MMGGDGLDRLWAPWRMQYIAGGEPKGQRNFIAHADSQINDRENLVVLRTDLSIVILNRFPYNNGHLLVAPRRTAAELDELSSDELLDLQTTLARMITLLRQTMKPDGFNIGLNLGRAAGAGLPEHLHWHVVPRWNGDVNFMSACSDTRVIVQSLDELWLTLRRALGFPDE
jgi:ATP adenylyltransferase